MKILPRDGRARIVVALVLLLPAAVLSPRPGAVVAQQPVFTADVDLVRLHVAVLDREGRPVLDLRPEEFRVLDGGREAEVSVLLGPEETALDVALVLDLSNSMRWQEGRTRAERLIATLSPRDCVFLLGFSSRVGGSLWAAPGDRALREALLNAEAFGGTALHDAVLVALTELDRSMRGPTLRGSTTAPLNPDLGGTTVRRSGGGTCPVSTPTEIAVRRRALVLVSDGMDSTSRAGLDDVRVTAALAELPIFPVRLPVDPGRGGRGRRGMAGVDGVAVLELLAETTGGAVVESDGAGYERLVALLRGTWVVGYRAATPPPRSRLVGERCAVRVEVDRPGVTVLHRPARLGSVFDDAAARQYVAEAAGFLDEGLVDAADAALSRALALDPEYAPAWHLRALAQAAAGRFEEALEDALRAVRLGPGAPDRHELAMRLALELNRGDLAWEQAVRAAQAGIDLDPYRDALAAAAPSPDDLEARLAAPRVAVARPYVEATHPLLDAGTEIVVRAMRRALGDAPELALVADPTLADFVVSVRARDVDLEPPHALTGTVRVTDRGGEVRYAGTLNVRDLESSEEVDREAAAHVRGLSPRISPR